MNHHAIIEAMRIGLHGFKCHFTGPKRYAGTAESICSQIIEGCWDPALGIFMTGQHNYPLFYARDFGMCIDSLLTLGYRERVRETLTWAMKYYKEEGRVTQIIRRNGKAYNFPDTESPDALAFVLHSIVALNDKELIKKYKPFLEKELARFTKAVVDKNGLCKRGMHLGGMRDYAIRDSSCYDNTMLAAIQKYATKLKLKNPLVKYNYEKLLIDNFWTGSYFKDDMVNDELTGDANVVPFWFQVLSKTKEKTLFKKSLKSIQKLKLDKPFTLRYEPHKNTSVKMHWMDPLTGSWETDTVWIHLGNLFLQATARLDPKTAKRYLAVHKQLIEREHHYPELLDKHGKPYAALFLHADDSMLWACNYLVLAKEFKL
ncbi:hypothetical protein GOV07_05240 [Candidatus Woesearchaeota archaeon]|nr:hypothetical protein [Candidatus Woesearchaeota archaeon]